MTDDELTADIRNRMRNPGPVRQRALQNLIDTKRWRGPTRTFAVYHYGDDGQLLRNEKVEAHQVSWPARGIAYYSMGDKGWYLEASSRVVDDAEVVRLYAEIDDVWQVVFEAPEGTVSIHERHRG